MIRHIELEQNLLSLLNGYLIALRQTKILMMLFML